MNQITEHTKLPEEFLNRMKEMLQEDFEDFYQSYQNPRTYGLRVNTSKITCEEFEKIVPFPVERIPWTTNGYFYKEDSRPSRSAIHFSSIIHHLHQNIPVPSNRADRPVVLVD